MVRVSQLSCSKEIKMRKRKYSELVKTFQSNFKTLINFYNLPLKIFAHHMDMDVIHVEKMYRGEYDTLSPFIVYNVAHYFGTDFHIMTHYEIFVTNNQPYYF